MVSSLSVSIHLHWGEDANNHVLSTVLPKFEVKVKLAEEASIGQKEIEAEVCAK